MFKQRNTNIGKLVTSPRAYPEIFNFDEISSLAAKYMTAKADVGMIDVPKILKEKRIVISPPKTEFIVPIYPLKRLQKGISGYDWDVNPKSEEIKSPVTRLRNSPTKDTFSSLFPSRFTNKRPFYKSPSDNFLSHNSQSKEYHKKSDDVVKYRESMLRAEQLMNNIKH